MSRPLYTFLASLVGCVLLALAVPGGAVEFASINVDYSDGVFRAEAGAFIQAPRGSVIAVLTDYQRLHALNESIVESRVMERPDGATVVVESLARGCLLIFCRSIRRVERVQEYLPDEIVAVVLPELSNITAQTAKWMFAEKDAGTDLRFEMNMQPGFWVPVATGRRQIKESMEQTFAQVERLAIEHAAGKTL